MSKIFKNFNLHRVGSNTSRGFSLVEMIIYIGLLAIILVGLVNMLLGMNRAYRYLKTSQHIQTSAVSALDRIVRDTRQSESIDVAGSTFDTNPGMLSLNTKTDSGVSQVVKFYVLNGVLMLQQDGADVGPLTLSDVVVNNLVFSQINTGASQAVKVEINLTSDTHTANFYATAILKNSY